MKKRIVLLAALVCLSNNLMADEHTIEIVPGLQIVNLPTNRASLTVLHQQAVYIVSEQGQAVIVFDFGNQEATYEGRAIFRGQTAVVPLRGKVFEHYSRERMPDGSYKLTDLGSQLTIDAGVASLEWSHGNRTKGHIYYRPEESWLYLFHRDYFDRVKFVSEREKDE